MRLVLVRHGAAEGAAGRCVGHADLALSAAGLAAVERLAEAWRADAEAGRAAVPAPTRLVTSDLARARASAAPFARAFGLAPAEDARLREMDFGAWDGRPWAELEAEDGARLGRWMADWAAERAPGGEGFGDVAARAGAWLAEARAAAAPGEVLLAVAHAGSLRAVLCALMGWPLAHAFRVRHDPARVTALRLPAFGAAGDAELLVLNADRVPCT